MKKFDLGQAIQLLANIGVLAGIIFLAFELRQNNEFARAEARNAMTQSIYTLLEMQQDPRWIAALERADEGQDPTFEDTIMLGSVTSAVFRHFENAFFQRQFGVYSEGQFAAETEQLRSALEDPRFAEYWDAEQSSHAVEFREFVNAIIEQMAD